MANRVFVLDTNRRPLDPVHPGRARNLLSQQRAAVFRRYPFTIIMRTAVESPVKPLRVKIDPGSKTTGLAIVDNESGQVVFAAELTHRGKNISDRLIRRRALRRCRRNRHTRYRKPRFLNRTRTEKWLAPSLKSRVHNISTWGNRFRRLASVQAISMELVRFDLQQMQNPEIQGAEYQQGTLFGYELREYLLEKWGRKCAYCDKENVPLQIEHIDPRSNGGSSRVSNLTLACEKCNQKKGSTPIRQFLANDPTRLERILANSNRPLRDVAAVNATRWDLFNTLRATGLPVETGSGGLTKYNRTTRSLPKAHWLDAACVGRSTPERLNVDGIMPLQIDATGYGNRQMCRTDKYGFPICYRQRTKTYFGFCTGDMCRVVVTTGKKLGTYVGKVMVRASGSFRLKTVNGIVDGLHHRFFTKVFSIDGYAYQH
mgnify:CR=1 FL=1